MNIDTSEFGVNACVFIGPTLSAELAKVELDAIFLPPAAQGDVYRVAAKLRPRVIGLVDGYFHQVPAVWHKEILWAMSHGIHVYGSASMGALRAAELDTFGMVGVGTIYEAFRNGRLEDDDEVAVIHGPPEIGFRAASEAMVNIRATLQAAEVECVIDAAARAELERQAKLLYFPDRSYQTLLARANDTDIPASMLDNLRVWLTTGRIDQKQRDALAMLCRIRDDLEPGLERKTPLFKLENTTFWTHAMNQVLLHDPGIASGSPLTLDQVLDELRLTPSAHRHALREALFRTLLLAEAKRRSITVDDGLVQRVTEQFSRRMGLGTSDETLSWMKRNHITPERFMSLMREEATLQLLEAKLRVHTERALPDSLLLSGAYEDLLERAADKQNVLESIGKSFPDLNRLDVPLTTILDWYFDQIPQTLTELALQEAQQMEIPFANTSALADAVIREYYYAHAVADRASIRGDTKGPIVRSVTE
jgi:hypothetical protein